MNLPLADVSPDEIFPFLLGGLVLITPIIAILTHHQRKMAEFLHRQGNQPPLQNAADPQLTQEISRLRDIVAQQTLAIDTLAKSQKALEERLSASDELRTRISG